MCKQVNIIDVTLSQPPLSLLQALLKLAPHYAMHQYKADDLWKVFTTDPAVSRGYVHRGNYRWPFIDVLFFLENATHVWCQNTWMRPRFVSERRYVFPLATRPFVGVRLPTPCDTGVVVHSMFSNIEECVSREHSHRAEVAFPRYMTRRVPCSELADSYPFVHRETIAGGYVNESLRLGGLTLYSVVLPPCEGGVKPH